MYEIRFDDIISETVSHVICFVLCYLHNNDKICLNWNKRIPYYDTDLLSLSLTYKFEFLENDYALQNVIEFAFS